MDTQMYEHKVVSDFQRTKSAMSLSAIIDPLSQISKPDPRLRQMHLDILVQTLNLNHDLTSAFVVLASSSPHMPKSCNKSPAMISMTPGLESSMPKEMNSSSSIYP